jgi:hypothetical protein
LYDHASTKLEKTQVIAAVVRKVRADAREYNGGAGGFVKKDYQTGLWYEIGDDKARDKVGHAIRRVVEDSKKDHKRSNSKVKSSGLIHSNSKETTTTKANVNSKESLMSIENNDDLGDEFNRDDKAKNVSPMNNERLNILLGQFSDGPKEDVSVRSRNSSLYRTLASPRNQSGVLLRTSFPGPGGNKSSTSTRRPVASTLATDRNSLPSSSAGFFSPLDNSISRDMFNNPGDHFYQPFMNNNFDNNMSSFNKSSNQMLFFQNQLAMMDASLNLNGLNQVNQTRNTTSAMDNTRLRDLTSTAQGNVGGMTVSSNSHGAALLLNSDQGMAISSGQKQSGQIQSSMLQTDGGYNTALMAYIQQRQEELRAGNQLPNGAGSSNQTLLNSTLLSQNYHEPSHFVGNIGACSHAPSSTTVTGQFPQGQQQFSLRDIDLGQLRRLSGFAFPSLTADAAMMGGSHSNDLSVTANIALSGSSSGCNLNMPTSIHGATSSAGMLGAPLGLEGWEEVTKTDHFFDSDEN